MAKRSRKQNDSQPITSSFFGRDDDEIATHIRIKTYNFFWLTDAIVPSYDLQIVPEQGFICRNYIGNECSSPMLTISASRQILFPLFMELVGMLGNEELCVILETSHKREHGKCAEIEITDVDAVTLRSTLWDFEDCLLSDGHAGIAITNADCEVSLDEHKLISVYGWFSVMYELLEILKRFKVFQKPDMKLINEAEHLHQSNRLFRKQFNLLKARLISGSG
jgi:hypothetical protein